MTRANLQTAGKTASPRPKPSHRRPGRPKLLDRDQILQVTLEMLEESGPAGFTMNKLAKRFGASVMTLYTYFPSREALLDDAASRIFSSFTAPPDDLPWREAVEAWLQALYELFAEQPAGLRLIKWDGAVKPSWLNVWMPLLRILSRAGFSGQPLVIASNWVGRTAMALLMARVSSPEETSVMQATVGNDGVFSTEDCALVRDLSQTVSHADDEVLYNFGIAQILQGLEELVRRENAAAQSR